MTARIFTWPQSRAVSPRRKTNFIAVHCSATPEGRDYDATNIDEWHRGQGWAGIGYHWVVHRDGSIEAGRPSGSIGAHVEGFNSEAEGVVYIGGLTADGKAPKDTRTPEQKAALLQLLRSLRGQFKGAVIQGHYQFPHVAKACPSFDAKREYATL